MDEERLGSLRELEGRLGYRFQDIARLEKALTHKSFTYELSSLPSDPSDRAANEVLEFLGDAVLNLAISHLLLQKFPEAHEGALSQKRAHLVKQASLSSLSRRLNLEEHLLLGKGELQNGGRRKASILANTYEAVIGAVYLDSGFERVLEMVHDHFRIHLQLDGKAFAFDDCKSLLQEFTQRTHNLSPEYQVLEEHGPDHDKRFKISVVIGGEAKGTGWGKNKKDAEQEAARVALETLNRRETP